MKQKYLILVCDSKLPKVLGAGCCNDRGGESIRQALTDRIAELDLSEEVQVKTSGCLANCALGVSVKIFPGPFLYGEISKEDIELLVEQHIVLGEPIERLLIPDKSFPGL